MNVKDIVLKTISSKDANKVIKSFHYSGKVVPNSKLHFGVFLDDKCAGAMQFGPSMRKDLMMPMVSGTKWNEFIELNRMAFADWLPRNSESRCIAMAVKLIKKHYPHIKWIVSFADGCQCGDGTIYRASGFYLVGIKKNTELKINPRTGETMATMAAYHQGYASEISTWDSLVGHMFKYIYFIDKECKDKLTIPIIPFSKIQELGVGMYKGKKITRVTKANSGDQLESGGAIPTHTLQLKKVV